MNKKNREKLKKRKLSKKKLLILLIILSILIITSLIFCKMPIKNIYIINNNILTDKEIINLANLNKETPLFKTYFMNITDKIKKSSYIKNVNIKRTLLGKIYITVEEYEPLVYYNNKVLLSSTKLVEKKDTIEELPYLKSDISSFYNEFVDAYLKINTSVRSKISEITYEPNEVDKRRFIFYMVDDNYLYINLNTIEKLNKYSSILSELEGKKGIINLDSGDYIEIKG